MNKLWKNRVPMKIKVFMWMAMQGKLQIGVNLKKKIGKGNRNWCLCGECETEDHIFFGCIMVKNVWSCFKEALGWDRIPHNLQDIFYSWLQLNCRNYHVKIFISAIVLWSIWNIRNKMGIQIFLKIYVALHFN